VAHLRHQLQQRDAEVAQLRLQVSTTAGHLHWLLVGRLQAAQVSASAYLADMPMCPAAARRAAARPSGGGARPAGQAGCRIWRGALLP
jgi:hypothetical protein